MINVSKLKLQLKNIYITNKHKKFNAIAAGYQKVNSHVKRKNI